MTSNISIKFFDKADRLGTSIDIPSFCLHCGATMTPDYLGNNSVNSYNDSVGIVALFLRCTSCGQYFTREFEYNFPVDIFNDKELLTIASELITSYTPPINDGVQPNIQELSPDFYEIYLQSLQTEQQGLDKIVGVGYRKALEFLIKDYAIKLYPDKATTIPKASLNQVITDYYKNLPRIQALSTVATWIGNDETHYVRKHPDKDSKIIKQFIISTMTFISAELDADVALEIIGSNQ